MVLLAKLVGRGKKVQEKEEFWALKDISFDVEQGDVIGIVGRNGAGKSTLLKILSKITSPTSGSAELYGRTASLLEVGTGFHPELTGYENIFLNGTILGMSKVEIRSKLEQIIDFAGIEKFINTPVKRYSSGMFVRLAFAVAAHLDPEILIVDEVLAVGDFDFQRKCLGRMEEITAEGRTVIFVSHNLGAVSKICNRVVLLKEGQLWDQGKTQEMLLKYQGVVKTEGHKDDVITLMKTPPETEEGAIVHCIEAIDEEGVALKEVGSCEPLTLKVTLEVENPDEPLGVTIGILSPEGVPLTRISTEIMKAGNLIPESKHVEVLFKIKSLPLAAGEFFLSAKVSRPGYKFLYENSMFAELSVKPRNLHETNMVLLQPYDQIAYEGECIVG